MVSKTPDNTCIYAIGDIHGRADLLRHMHTLILEDAEKRSATKKIAVYLGDYVDRGDDSKEVIHELIYKPLKGFESHYLVGNHEYYMLKFMQQEPSSFAWLKWGGESTLRSYGVDIRDETRRRRSARELGEVLSQQVPRNHHFFLKNLKEYIEIGDYLFVHAGINPLKAVQQQTIEDFTMIRDAFYASNHAFDKTVIFGHTIFDEPLEKTDRIGIDTGAYATGKLTCVVLEHETRTFLQT